MIKTIRILRIPNNKPESKFSQPAKKSNVIYNQRLSLEDQEQFLRLRNKKKLRFAIYIDTYKVLFTDTNVKLEKLTIGRKNNTRQRKQQTEAELDTPYGL